MTVLCRLCRRPLDLAPSDGDRHLNCPHEWDDDAVCIHCGFDGAEWAHWKKNTYEGRASDAKMPPCKGDR